MRYFRRIQTGVCFDNKCRELQIILYWNITGRYLGFELPKDEYLSKTEHEPFTREEYERLHALLADQTLPLGNNSFNELIEAGESETPLLDGVSGATSKDLSEMVVKGAAYTTYKLWNLVYGPTRERIISHTEIQLTPELINQVLKSPDQSDRIWALNRIDQSTKLNSKLSSLLLDLVSGEDYYLAYSAVNAIGPVHLDSDIFQVQLFSQYGDAAYSIKKMIIEKIKKAPYLSENLIASSRGLLEQLNGQQLGDFLEMYSIHSVRDLETCRVIADILANENRYISQKAYNFLKGVEISDSIVNDKIIYWEQKANQY